MTFYNWITLVATVFLTILILVQTRGASLGAGFGASSEINTVRRGSDRTLHQLTIIIAIVFAASIVLGIIT